MVTEILSILTTGKACPDALGQMNCQRWACNIQTNTSAESYHFGYCVKIKFYLKNGGWNIKELLSPHSPRPFPSLKLPVLVVLLKLPFHLRER